jgi:hypothetical protein
MLRDLSFKDVCEFIKADDPSFLDAADKLLGLGLILSPLALGLPPEATASVLGLIEVKNELVKLGKDLFEKVTRRKDEDTLAQQERMRVVYGLICYTAFFEAVDQVMPEIKKPLGLQPEEKFLLSKGAVSRAQGKSNTQCSLDEAVELLEDWKVVFPHPVDSLERQNDQLLMLYEELSKGFMSFLQGLTVWESASHETKENVSKAARQLPQVALNCFEAQYYQLAAKFPEFSVWSNLQEHKKTRAQTDLLSAAMSDFHKQYASLVKATNKATNKSIDQGFLKLSQVIEAIPSQIEQFKANKALEDLGNYYKYVIEQPIIKDPYEAGEGAATLTFPKKSQTFIPQSFKVIRCTTGKERLENEATWINVKSRNDLGAFLISYLSSPYSKAAPLIILGHPGSGKSLLTQLLSARLWSSLHIPIRVELRDINAENDIPAQIHDQIRKDIDRNVRWTDLTDYLSECTPIVILDGYDELLQASGKVFSGYLRKIQEFQEQQTGINKPIAAIVTSRITLIDKADIPLGATVIRLEEFDETRRNKWISFWNKTNQKYFKQAQIEPFELPANKKIIPLAEQPLLLLMLALYDSEENQLRKSKGLDQTLLYDNLIRRFIKREKLKDKSFRDLEESTRDVEVDKDMARLGVAAISMFNQRSLYIRSEQLNKALTFFKLERVVHDSSGRSLSQAELLLGSFFFIHQSKSSQKSENPQERKLETAFEFLHNTFGEFLTAEFILRQVLNETNTLHDFKQNPRLKSALEQRLETPDGFSEAWFVSLIYTPLYSRPVILDMMREWLKHKLVASENNHETFLKDFDTIIANQINRLLTNKNLPSIMMGGKETCFQELPLVGYISIYSLNLILLRTILSPEGFTFDEENISPHEDGTRVWDQLTYLWRSWFSLDNLNGLTAILAARREENKIFIKAKESFSLPSFSDRLDSLLAVSITLADNIVAGVTGLIRHSSLTERNALPLSEVQNRLESENIDLSLKILVERLKCEFRQPSWQGRHGREQEILETAIRSLHVSRWSEPEDIADLIRLIRESENLHFNNQFLEILLHEMPPFEHFLYEHPSLWFETAKLLRNSSNLLFSDYFIERFFSRVSISLFESLRPKLTLEIIQIAREVGDRKIFERLSEVFLERLHPRYLEEISPNGAVEVMRLAREIGDPRIFERLSEVFLERLHPRYLEEISPDGAVELIRLISKIGDQRILDQLLEAFLETLNPRYLEEMSPEAMVELMQLAQEIDNQNFLGGVSEAFIKWLHPRYFVRLSPDLMIELMRSARKVGNQKFIRRMLDVFIEGLHPRYYLRLSPETVIELIELSKELDDQRMFKQMVGVFFEQIKSNNIKKINFETIRNFIVWLRLNVSEGNKKRFYTQFLRLFNFSECPFNLEIEILLLASELNDKKVLNLVFNTSSQEISDGGAIEAKKLFNFRQELFENIGNLPLNTLKSIRRLAQKFSDEQLVIEIDRQLHPDSN